MQRQNEILKSNAISIQNELKWLDQCFQFRIREVSKTNKSKDSIEPDSYPLSFPSPPDIKKQDSIFSEFLLHYVFDETERTAIILALLPYFFPGCLEQYASEEKINPVLSHLNLKKDKSGQLFPSGNTLLFLLAGSNLELRLRLLSMFDKNHIFSTNDILSLGNNRTGKPQMNEILLPHQNLIEIISKGFISKPDLNPDFPAKLITTKIEWDDLILPAYSMGQIQEIEDWIKWSPELNSDSHLGNKLKSGYKALFYGPPGTGKTLTATLIGKKTGRDVYRVDLSTVVSKYIGETEKNLKKLFDRAERKNWILFFDEADALFGKRTSVSNSNDRYANQEVSYLLQRLEYFDGLVILASNMKSNIDKAFMRRFQNIIHFPVPNANERLKLWKNIMPEIAEQDESVNLEKIAKDHELTGANIVNVIAHSTLKTMKKEKRVITASDIRKSIATELAKEGKTL